MSDDFKLSDKIEKVSYSEYDDTFREMLQKEDVKEFIKQLKESFVLDIKAYSAGYCEDIFNKIDKLAGEDLIWPT